MSKGRRIEQYKHNKKKTKTCLKNSMTKLNKVFCKNVSGLKQTEIENYVLDNNNLRKKWRI